VLRHFRRSDYFNDRADWTLAPSADGGVDFQDLVTTIDVAARVGLTDVTLTTSSDLEAWSQLEHRHWTWWPQSSRVVLEDCWRYAICPRSSLLP
jgi:hypothetical protein